MSQNSIQKTLKYVVMEKHLKFIARAVVVQERNLVDRCKTLNRTFTIDSPTEDSKGWWGYKKVYGVVVDQQHGNGSQDQCIRAKASRIGWVCSRAAVYSLIYMR